jgi:hypothetical protein
MRGQMAFAVAVVVALGGAVACSSSTSLSESASSAQTLTFQMKQTIAPSSESFRCQYYQMPDDHTWANKISHTYTPGSHHMILYRTDLTAIPADKTDNYDCYANGADFMTHVRGYAYGSQEPKDEFDLPDHVAFAYAPGEVLMMQTHYLNATPKPIDSSVNVTLTFTDPSNVQQNAGALLFYDPYIYVPAGGTAQAAMRCPINYDINVLRVIPHTHARGVGFAAFLDPGQGPPATEPFYTSTDWEHPAPFNGPMTFTTGTKVRFDCEYDNRSGTQDYIQGQSALTNEMCVFAAVYYPDHGLLQNYCAQGSDDYGTGTATCSQLLDCVTACLRSEADARDACSQKCVVASCPSAWRDYAPLATCVSSGCGNECAPGAPVQGCIDCSNAKCASSVASCRAAACGSK